MKERVWLKLFDKYNYTINEVRHGNHLVVKATRDGRKCRFVLSAGPESDIRTIKNFEAALKRGHH